MDTNKIILSILLSVIVATPAITNAESFTFGSGCAITITSNKGNVVCSTWQKGSKAVKSGIDVATCICTNTCLSVPLNHYYYNDPVNKTRQSDENSLTLPLVLAWDNVEAWQKEDGSYVWNWPAYAGASGKETVTSKIFGVQSYVLEIDNTNNDLNDSQSTGGIFRRILKTNEFNPEKDFYPCFFNSATTYKWRVRPCCNSDGSNCLPENQAPWWEFTTSPAPEPINPDDTNWNGSGNTNTVSFDGLQIKWCRVYFQKYKRYATSYKLMVTSDESGGQSCHPLLKMEGECKDEDIYADATSGKVVTSYPVESRQDYAFFTRNRTYVWKMRTCYSDNANDCSDYGQAWTISTKTDPIGTPRADYPENDPAGNKLIGLPVKLSWSVPDGANSFIYETSFDSGEKKSATPNAPGSLSTASEKAVFDADNLQPNTQYKWRVRACSNFNSSNCDGWSEWFLFTTTGRPPKTESLSATSNIPADFVWEAVEGAKSYNFSLQKAGEDPVVTVLNTPKMLEKPEFTVNYPDIDQQTTYYWKIQTCAHDNGTACGEWSAENSITTSEITTPLAARPAAGETIYADQPYQTLSWSGINGSLAYRYTLTLANPAENSDCQQETIEGITTTTSKSLPMNCLGEYSLAVVACVDAQCQSVSPKGEWNFTLDQREPSSKNSLAVCGTGYDKPDTAWNEREECGPKHLALLIKVFLDFLLFKLSFFLLPILVLITGFLFYSPFGTPDLLGRVKTMWKAVGIGYALLLFGWLITGIILSLIGYQALWWKIL